jgi:serine/threonine protein phosphatase PrpC
MFGFSPDHASVTSFNVEENDFIVIATDGLWDNLPDSTIVEEIKKINVSVDIVFIEHDSVSMQNIIFNNQIPRDQKNNLTCCLF